MNQADIDARIKYREGEMYSACPIPPESTEECVLKVQLYGPNGKTRVLNITPAEWRGIESVLLHRK